jgi:threonine synthase
MSRTSEYLSHLECSKCGNTYDPDQLNQICSCGAPLLVRYDLRRLAAEFRKSGLINRPSSLWRYKEFLPVRKEENIVTLGEGMTPVIPLRRIGDRLGLKNLYMKDEGIIPTGTFKARGAAVGVSKAKELGVKVLAMPTNGNAGGA